MRIEQNEKKKKEKKKREKRPQTREGQRETMRSNEAQIFTPINSKSP